MLLFAQVRGFMELLLFSLCSCLPMTTRKLLLVPFWVAGVRILTPGLSRPRERSFLCAVNSYIMFSNDMKADKGPVAVPQETVGV